MIRDKNVFTSLSLENAAKYLKQQVNIEESLKKYIVEERRPNEYMYNIRAQKK